MACGERLPPQRPGRPKRIERQVKDFPQHAADEDDAEIDPKAREPDQRLHRNYERRYFIAAAIPSTRNTTTSSQSSPIPHIMGMLDISIIMNALPSRAESDGPVTHFRPRPFTASITPRDSRVRRCVFSSHTESRQCVY